MAMAAPAPAPPAQSWFAEQSARTPLVCKSAIVAIIVSTLVAYLTQLQPALLLFPAPTLLGGQAWRFLTAPLVQGDALAVVFCSLVFAVQAPPDEVRAGSLAFLAHVALSSALINVLFVLLACALGAISWGPLAGFLIVPGNGAWPVLIMLLSERALADRAGSTKLCCFDVPNPFYGWTLALFFSLFSLFPMLDMFIAVAVAHAC